MSRANLCSGCVAKTTATQQGQRNGCRGREQGNGGRGAKAGGQEQQSKGAGMATWRQERSSGVLKESSTTTRATLCVVSQLRVARQGAKSQRGSKLSRKAPLPHSNRWDPCPPARCSTHGYTPWSTLCTALMPPLLLHASSSSRACAATAAAVGSCSPRVG